MPDTSYYYRLKDLIAAKYGIGRLALGYEIVARWISFETHKHCSMEQVEFWSNLRVSDMPDSVDACVGMLIGYQESIALTSLFDLTHNVQLLTPINTHYETGTNEKR